MGKNKAQRTKNNAKPSNSARSAEFLGSAMPNFVGFSAVKDGGYVPVLPGLSLNQLNEVEISAIDSNFQVVFKKMNKKDATTKFKALQEFADLVKESPLQTVEAILPFWPKLYSTLAVDVEHRVRDAAQITHGVLIKKVGKSIATYLKQLAGPWFTSQFDPFPPAASAASNSLHDTFPDKKYVDAIVYCQDEILSYICYNINVQTPQLLNIIHKSMNLAPEILEAKYQRILICSLQGYCSYLKQAPHQQIEKTSSSHHQIINGNKFWKLAKHEIPLIKISFFNIITSLIENCKDILKDSEKKTITSIMNSLDENETGVISAVWECMLIAIDKIDDWYTHVSIEKLVLPKLWRVLRSGGQGCASIIYPNLLPLISQFPKFDLDKKNLFFNFFDNMSQGFMAKNVLVSRSEITAIIKSYIECLRYTILLNNNDIDLCGKLVKEQLIPAIESFITDYTPVKLVLLNEAAELLRYWSKNRNSEDYKSYGELIIIFWNELELMFDRFMDRESETFEKVTVDNIWDAQIKLLTALKCSSNVNRKSLRIKFEDTDAAESKEQLNSQQSTDDVLVKEINNFVTKLCIKLINNYDKNTSSIIDPLSRLICQFESQFLFEEVCKVYTNGDNLLEFYNKTFKVWLADNNAKVNEIVKIIFTLLQYMKGEDKNSVLNSLTSMNNSKVLNCAISCALNDKNMNDQVIKSWRKADYTSEYLSQLTEKVISDNCEESKKVLLQSFKSCGDDFCISEQAVCGVLNVLCDYLTQSEEIAESLITFTSQLSLLIWNYKKLIAATLKLFKTLFKINNKDSLSLDLKESVQTSWTTGLISIYHKITPNELFKLQEECMKIMYEKMYSSDFKTSDGTDFILNFLEASNNYNYDEALASLIKFNNNVEKNSLDKWVPQVKNFILHTEIVCGNFNSVNPIKSVSLECPIRLSSEPEEEQGMPEKMMRCLKWSLFTTKLINKLIMQLNDEYEDDEFESIIKSSLDNSSEQFRNILLITSLGKLYNDHYKFFCNADAIKQIYVSLHFECKSLREKIPLNIWKEIILDSLDVDKYWTEWGSTFSLFLQYYADNKIYFSEIKSQAKEILSDYTTEGENSVSLIQDVKAVILAQLILNDDDDDDESNTLSLNVLEKIIKRNQVDKEFLLFNRDISFVSWSEFILPLELVRLLTKSLQKVPTKMTTEMRDAAVIYLSSWLISLNKSIAHHKDLKLQCFVVALSQLFCAVKNLLSRVLEKDFEEIRTGFVDEWHNIFADDINCEIANTWMYYADLFSNETEFLTPILMLNYLGNAIKLLDGVIFFKELTDAPITVTSDDLIKFSLKLILSPIQSLQLSAHHALNRLIPTLVEHDKNTIEQENFDATTLNIYKFEDIILQTQKIVDTILLDFKLCDTITCTVKLYTDSYTYTFGYILIWLNVLEMCSYAHADLRYQYGEILKNDYFSSLMNNIFRLMPAKMLEFTDKRTPLFEFVNLFKDQPLLNLNDSLTSSTLDHVVCWVYTNCLRYMPVLARQWWSEVESRVGSTMEKITTLYVSPILCREELTVNKLNDVPNLTIIVYPTVRELNAVYRMDDSKLELKMILPTNYPLGTVTVEPRQHAGGAANWKNSHMQLSIFLNHQNGSVWDGLMMWKNNLDKKFSGVEECYICFSIFHINTYQIPKLSCHTCRKKFHAPCLYKWFSTSQKSTCPICRNIF